MFTSHYVEVGRFTSVWIGRDGCRFAMNDYLCFAIGVGS